MHILLMVNLDGPPVPLARPLPKCRSRPVVLSDRPGHGPEAICLMCGSSCTPTSTAMAVVSDAMKNPAEYEPVAKRLKRERRLSHGNR